MQRLYRCHDLPLAGHLQQVLEQHGFVCFVKNAYLAGGAGELPPTEVWPELWIADDADRERALQILQGVLAEDVAGEPWRCPRCGEWSEPQFAECWQCGGPAP